MSIIRLLLEELCHWKDFKINPIPTLHSDLQNLPRIPLFNFFLIRLKLQNFQISLVQVGRFQILLYILVITDKNFHLFLYIYLNSFIIVMNYSTMYLIILFSHHRIEIWNFISVMFTNLNKFFGVNLWQYPYTLITNLNLF